MTQTLEIDLEPLRPHLESSLDAKLAGAYRRLAVMLGMTPADWSKSYTAEEVILHAQDLNTAIRALAVARPAHDSDSGARERNFCRASELYERALSEAFAIERERVPCLRDRAYGELALDDFSRPRLRVRRYDVLYSLGYGPFLLKDDVLSLEWVGAANYQAVEERARSARRAKQGPKMNLIEAHRAVLAWIESAASANAKIVCDEGDTTPDGKIVPVNRQLGIAEAKLDLDRTSGERYLVACLSIVAARERLHETIFFSLPCSGTTEEIKILQQSTGKACRCGDWRFVGAGGGASQPHCGCTDRF
jgi:hypothetical protein